MKNLFTAVVVVGLFASQALAAWTATPIKKSIDTGKLVVVVEYINGAARLSKTHRVDTYAQYLLEVRSEVKRLDGLDTDAPKVTIGVPVDVSIPAPSQDDLDRLAFIALVQDYKAKRAAVDAGLSKTLTQMDVDAAYAAMKAAYKDAYAKLVSF